MIEPLSAATRKRLEGTLVVASVSGGKDSAAMSLWLTEQGIEHQRVFADTGWEADETYEYLRGPLVAKLGPIEEVRGERTFEELCRWKGMFPSRTKRFCTQFLKIFPLYGYINRLAEEHDVVNAVGIRRAESAARARFTEWDESEGLDATVWRPLVGWTEQDVIDMHKRHGLAPNPLYLRGARRVGCYPCIFASKDELRLIAQDEARVQRIRDLEEQLTSESKADVDVTMFTMATRNKDGERPPIPIDQVLRWAKTERGGKQLAMFDRPQYEGCARWGMCEPATQEDA